MPSEPVSVVRITRAYHVSLMWRVELNRPATSWNTGKLNTIWYVAHGKDRHDELAVYNWVMRMLATATEPNDAK